MKNILLKIVNTIAFILMMIFISSVDSKNIMVPIVGMIICGTWLYLFYSLNKDTLLEEDEL